MGFRLIKKGFWSIKKGFQWWDSSLTSRTGGFWGFGVLVLGFLGLCSLIETENIYYLFMFSFINFICSPAQISLVNRYRGMIDSKTYFPAPLFWPHFWKFENLKKDFFCQKNIIFDFSFILPMNFLKFTYKIQLFWNFYPLTLKYISI